MTAQAPDSDDRREPTQSRVSALHSRTFEMELLVSGVVVFGLLQLPARVDRFFLTLIAGLSGGPRMAAVAGQAYVSMVLYALLGTFLLHLIARAFWIGLVGLESVFPEGIRWDRAVRDGPFTKERYQRGVPSLAAAIDRVDDVCSLIFSCGFLIALTFIYSVFAALVAALFGLAVSWLVPAMTGFWIGLGLIGGVQIVASVLDKRLGGRVVEGSFAHHCLRWLVNLAFLLSPMRWIGPITLTLATNLSGNKFALGFNIVVMTLGLSYVGLGLVTALGMRPDTLTHFPDSLHSEGVDPRHYRNLRPAGFVDARYPSIQSDVVDEDYLKLVLPYHARRLGRLIERSCPDLEPLRSGWLGSTDGREPDSEAIRTAAACLGGLFAIELDHVPRHDLVFDFTREPESGLAALVTYIPVASLDPGRHQLVVLMPGNPKRFRDDDEPPPIRHLIPFWL